MSWGSTFAFLCVFASLWVVEDRVTRANRDTRDALCLHIEAMHRGEAGYESMLKICRGPA